MSSPQPTEKRRNWLVRVECTVIKNLIVENCTKEEAWFEPWKHVAAEVEMERYDLVRNVSPNE